MTEVGILFVTGLFLFCLAFLLIRGVHTLVDWLRAR